LDDPVPPDDGAIRDEITRLEARIEALAESLDRCRKIALLARLVLAAGAIWIALIALRLLPFAPFHIVGAISAVLGGTVLFGSNASTRKQTAAALAEAEQRRADLIDRIAMQTVEEGRSGRLLQ
jgi:hypothetical protein